MPCMGPGINSAELNRAYEEIMALLRDKYDIQRPVPVQWCGFRVGNCGRLRCEHNAKFKKALEDLFQLQACEDF